MNIFNLDNMTLFILLFVPGFISWKVWQLMVPVNNYKPVDYFLEVLSYGCINFAFILVLVWFTTKDLNNIYPFIIFLSFLILPVWWPILIKQMRELECLKGRSVAPIPKAWDYFFMKGEPCFILVHLSNGKLIGGLYIGDSYTSSFPNAEDIYISQVWRITESGGFISKLEDTAGVWISKDNFDYLEFFHIKYKEADKNEQK